MKSESPTWSNPAIPPTSSPAILTPAHTAPDTLASSWTDQACPFLKASAFAEPSPWKAIPPDGFARLVPLIHSGLCSNVYLERPSETNHSKTENITSYSLFWPFFFLKSTCPNPAWVVVTCMFIMLRVWLPHWKARAAKAKICLFCWLTAVISGLRRGLGSQQELNKYLPNEWMKSHNSCLSSS